MLARGTAAAATTALLGAAVALLWRRLIRAEAEAAAAAKEAEAELSTLRMGLDRLSKQQRHTLCAVPAQPPSLVPTSGWSACVASIEAVFSGYDSARRRRQRPNAAAARATPDACGRILVSAFDLERGGGEFKARVDALLAKHATTHLGSLADQMASDPSLLLLLLDAPSCATTTALTQALPGLARFGGRICVPQADPSHYDMMVNHQAASSRSAPPLLNVRWQRLDAWLSSNAGRRLRCACFFADYETSVYGKASLQLSPLRDLQRFFRCSYAADTCLLGVTLSLRMAHTNRYEGPQLTAEDVGAFVETEAAAQGLRCVLLEEVRYAMLFQLFLLRRE